MAVQRRRAGRCGETFLRLVLPSGKFCDVTIAGTTATVKDVKKALLANWPLTWAAEIDRSRVTGVRLMFGGRFLNDNTLINDLGLPCDQYVTIHAILRICAAQAAMHGSGEFCAHGVHESGCCNHSARACGSNGSATGCRILPNSFSSLSDEARGWSQHLGSSFSYLAGPFTRDRRKPSSCNSWCCIM